MLEQIQIGNIVFKRAFFLRYVEPFQLLTTDDIGVSPEGEPEAAEFEMVEYDRV